MVIGGVLQIFRLCHDGGHGQGFESPDSVGGDLEEGIVGDRELSLCGDKLTGRGIERLR